VKVGKRIWAKLEEHKLLTIFCLGMIVDFWAQWYMYAVNHDWIVLQALVGMMLPILNFPLSIWFIDEKDHKVRFKYVLCASVSMTVGSTVMLLMVREGWIVGQVMQ
jgi:EamA domain-containing membrane protein RarD